MKVRDYVFVKFAIVVVSILGLVHTPIARADDEWKTDWRVAPGFSITSDTTGYRFPTAIAFVPQPGPGPKDPLYFVTEIRGTIKVVTNDRSVYVFSDELIVSTPPEELPALAGETGMVGLVLEPENGYVYVSFSYRDSDNVLRNNIVRFETEPGVFSLKPKSHRSFASIFASEPSDQSHQIGPMVVHDGHLYVAVGDARQPVLTRDINSTLGKILRMNLDGGPVASNPYFEDDGKETPADFVWAIGLRNPFGLTVAEGRLFATDNGPGVDRFIRVVGGADYGYDGSDWSMGIRSKAVFAPAVGLVQLAYLAPSSNIFPIANRSRFYITLAGHLAAPPGPGLLGQKSVVAVDYDMAVDAVNNPPQQFLQYRGPGLQLPVSLAFGSDGLYVVPLLPDATGESRVLKVAYDPDNEHAFVIGLDEDPRSLIARKGCLGCHSFDPDTDMVGPTLNTDLLNARIDQKLNSKEYLAQLDQLDALDGGSSPASVSARDEVRNAVGAEKFEVYIRNKVLNPSFDNPSSQMPNLGLSLEEAKQISEYLALGPGSASLIDRIKLPLVRLVPRPRLRHLGAAFAIGAGSALLAFSIILLAFRRRRSRIGQG